MVWARRTRSWPSLFASKRPKHRVTLLPSGFEVLGAFETVNAVERSTQVLDAATAMLKRQQMTAWTSELVACLVLADEEAMAQAEVAAEMIAAVQTLALMVAKVVVVVEVNLAWYSWLPVVVVVEEVTTRTPGLRIPNWVVAMVEALGQG
jgi:hypothetical protein